MRVGIALGSNLGDRGAQLQAAVRAIRAFAKPPILVSRVYETEPVDCPPGSPTFLNAAIEIEWQGSLHALLECLQAIELVAGRQEIRERNAPRPVDLDILYAGDLTLDTPSLKVPHPRMMERAFVLLPLNDIIPNGKIPGFVNAIAEQVKTLNSSDYNFTQISIDE